MYKRQDYEIQNFVPQPYFQNVSKEGLTLTSKTTFKTEEEASKVADQYNRAGAKVIAMNRRKTVIQAPKLFSQNTCLLYTSNKDLTKVNVAKNLILGTIKRACLLSTDRKMIRILLKANKETNLLNIQGKSDRGSINCLLYTSLS